MTAFIVVTYAQHCLACQLDIGRLFLCEAGKGTDQQLLNGRGGEGEGREWIGCSTWYEIQTSIRIIVRCQKHI